MRDLVLHEFLRSGFRFRDGVLLRFSVQDDIELGDLSDPPTVDFAVEMDR